MTPTKTPRERFLETLRRCDYNWYALVESEEEELLSVVENLLEEARQETKEKCAKKAFDFADNLEKKTWVDASYARAVWNLILSL